MEPSASDDTPTLTQSDYDAVQLNAQVWYETADGPILVEFLPCSITDENYEGQDQPSASNGDLNGQDGDESKDTAPKSKKKRRRPKKKNKSQQPSAEIDSIKVGSPGGNSQDEERERPKKIEVHENIAEAGPKDDLGTKAATAGSRAMSIEEEMMKSIGIMKALLQKSANVTNSTTVDSSAEMPKDNGKGKEISIDDGDVNFQPSNASSKIKSSNNYLNDWFDSAVELLAASNNFVEGDPVQQTALSVESSSVSAKPAKSITMGNDGEGSDVKGKGKEARTKEQVDVEAKVTSSKTEYSDVGVSEEIEVKGLKIALP